MNITGKILKNLRLKRNVTLDQLAAELNEIFNISITGSMLSKWETGKAAPIYDHLKRLASYYEVTTDFLLGFDHYENLTDINSDLDSDKSNKRIRYSKKYNKIKNINKIFEDDRITNKDLSIFEDFLNIYVAKKDKNPYR